MVAPSKTFRTHAQYISTVIGIIAMCAIIIYHSITTYQHHKKIEKKTDLMHLQTVSGQNCIHKLSLERSSFLMLITGLIYCVSGFSEVAYTDFISEDKTTCYTHFFFIVSSYGCFKMFMYVALCRRLIEAFGDRRNLLIMWEIFLILASILSMVLCPIYITLTVEPENRPPCNIVFDDMFLMGLLLYDTIACIVNIVLFIRPLCKLTSTVNSDGQKSKTFKTKYRILIKKNAILASISIVTSFVVWVILGFVSGIAVMMQTIDILVSGLAVILLFSRNSWLYAVLCCCCRTEFNRAAARMTSKSQTSSVQLPEAQSSAMASNDQNKHVDDVELGRNQNSLSCASVQP